MKKHLLLLAAVLVCCLPAVGCGQKGMDNPYENISFQDEQWYAVAYLGYQDMEDLSYYQERYLKGADVPVHYISPGDFYLVIPRYSDMAVTLFQNEIEGGEPIRLFSSASCVPFVVQCNISDIFPDLTVELCWNGETLTFSPYISLKDGSLLVGERGLELTEPA